MNALMFYRLILKEMLVHVILSAKPILESCYPIDNPFHQNTESWVLADNSLYIQIVLGVFSVGSFGP